jgi:hypothetical protein
MEVVDMCMIYLITNYTHMPGSSSSLIVARNPKRKYKFHTTAILLPYVLRK